MEYEVVLQHEELIFYQKHDTLDSASQQEEEEEEEYTRIHPDNTYFFFAVPLKNIRRIAPGYYKADVHEIVLRDENEFGDEEYSVKIYNSTGYMFKLELTEETYTSVVSMLETTSPKKGGRRTRRKRIPKTRNNKSSPQNASHDT